eukprot:7772574-Lingulodinium_polyedra.AAC.1
MDNLQVVTLVIGAVDVQGHQALPLACCTVRRDAPWASCRSPQTLVHLLGHLITQVLDEFPSPLRGRRLVVWCNVLEEQLPRSTAHTVDGHGGRDGSHEVQLFGLPAVKAWRRIGRRGDLRCFRRGPPCNRDS